ncbi:MAG: hypothetical protein P8Y27_10940, partial [Chromatiaceae bacterium]
RSEDCQTPTPPARASADYIKLVAIIGGYLARRKDPPPGHQLMWLVNYYLQHMCEGYRLRDELSRPSILVGNGQP